MNQTTTRGGTKRKREKSTRRRKREERTREKRAKLKADCSHEGIDTSDGGF